MAEEQPRRADLRCPGTGARVRRPPAGSRSGASRCKPRRWLEGLNPDFAGGRGRVPGAGLGGRPRPPYSCSTTSGRQAGSGRLAAAAACPGCAAPPPSAGGARDRCARGPRRGSRELAAPAQGEARAAQPGAARARREPHREARRSGCEPSTAFQEGPAAPPPAPRLPRRSRLLLLLPPPPPPSRICAPVQRKKKMCVCGKGEGEP